MAGPKDPGPAMVYKGDGWKIISTTEVEEAIKDGWFREPLQAIEASKKAELKTLQTAAKKAKAKG